MAGQIIRRGDRTWLLRVFVGRDGGGKRRYHNKTVHGTKKEADAALRALLGQRDRGQLLTIPKSTVNEYLNSWLNTIAPSVAARTLGDYAETLSLYCRPHLGQLLLASVTPVEVRSMLAQLQKADLKPRTVRKAHEVLRNALEQAVADGFLTNNPARSRLVSKALPAKEHVERPTVTRDQLSAFINASADRRLNAYYLAMLFCGLRPEEALALRWSDATEKKVTVRRVLVDGKHGMVPHFTKPKTKKSARSIPLPEIVIAALLRHRRTQIAEQLIAGPAWQGQDLIFCDEVGAPLRQDRTRREFKALLKAAQLPPMRPYDLRHSAATLLLEAGEDLKVVSELLGHSTIVLTADTYAHVTPGMKERAVAKLDRLTAEIGS